MALRIGKLAKQLKRSEEEVLEVAANLGLPYTRAADQLTKDAEVRLRAKLKDVPIGAVVPRSPKLPPEPPRAAFSDPLADSWMDLALADDTGLKQAMHDRFVDRKLNARAAPARKLQEEPSRPRYDDDDPPSTLARPSRPAKVRAKTDKSPDEVLKGLGFAGISSRKDIEPLLPEEVGALLHKTHLTPDQARQIEVSVPENIARSCGDRECTLSLLKTQKPVIVISSTTSCDHCSGSNIQRSVQGLIDACAQHEITRLLVVGGSPNSHEELRARLPEIIELKLILGNGRVNSNQAKDHLRWCEVAAIWAPTPLDHKVSNLYRGGRTGAGRKPVHVEHRGVEMLAQTVTLHLQG